MGTPKHKPRAILKDSLSNLKPKVGTGRAPSHAAASEEATDCNQTFTLESIVESKMAKNDVHKATRPSNSEDIFSTQEAKNIHWTMCQKPPGEKDSKCPSI